MFCAGCHCHARDYHEYCPYCGRWLGHWCRPWYPPVVPCPPVKPVIIPCPPPHRPIGRPRWDQVDAGQRVLAGL